MPIPVLPSKLHISNFWRKNLNSNFLYYRQSESPPPQRSLSELELFKQKHNLPEEGEFYTAIGPDGKKVLLSKKQKNFYYRKSKHHQKPKL